MKNLYRGFVNILIFFFVIDLFGSVITIGDGTFYEKMVYAIIFSALMYVIPHILLFFKIPVSEISELLVGAGLSFVYFFLGYYLLDFVKLSSTIFDPKLPFIEPINFVDKSIVLLFIGALATALSVGIQSLNKKKKKSSLSSSSSYY